MSDILSISHEIALGCMPQDLTDTQSTLVQVMVNKPLSEPMLTKFYDTKWSH